MPAFLFFDVGGTLLHFAPSHALVVGAALREGGLEVSADDAASAVRAARKAQGGRPDPVNLEANRDWWLGFFGGVLVKLGRDSSDPLRDELYAHHRSGSWLHPADDTVATLERLAACGHRMAVISNWDDTLEAILGRRGLLPFFEFVVSSANTGAAKPDARIFEAALSRAGVAPHEAVHVGDEFDADVRGARNVGIRPVFLTSRTGGQKDDALETIGSLGHLIDLVR